MTPQFIQRTILTQVIASKISWVRKRLSRISAFFLQKQPTNYNIIAYLIRGVILLISYSDCRYLRGYRIQNYGYL